jgi:exocyst complex protein 7
MVGIPPNRVVRTEKVGSGGYSSLAQQPLKTGIPHVDAFGEARKNVAFSAVDGYYRRLKQERKKNAEKNRSMDGGTGGSDDAADVAARDAVRCLEHTMIVVAGERNVYRTIVAPSLKAKPMEEDVKAIESSPHYKKACVVAYSHVVGSVVDRTMDVLETVFLKEGGIGQSSGGKGDKSPVASNLDVRTAASAAVAGLRMLDGVRMLGPSLAKLCEVPNEEGADAGGTIAAALCIAIHRTTVKNTSRTLENLAKAVQDDPLDGPEHRPKDARIASVSSDVVRAIRLVSPFVSAYKSVTKRR